MSRTPFTRSTNACESCRRRKVKCSGDFPCLTCSRQGLECIFGDAGRRGFSQAYVQSLLNTIKQKDEQLKAKRGDSRASADDIDAEGADDDPVAGPLSTSSHHDDSDIGPSASIAQSDLSLSPAELASGPAFESRVRSIFRDRANSNNILPTELSTTPFSSSQGDRSVSRWEGATDLVQGVPPPNLLEKERSYELFDAFISLLGVNQHFLDSRVFLDSLDLLYRDGMSQTSQMQSIWFTQYLLVMAVAMLIGSPTEGSNSPPGNDLFAEAMRRMPPIHQMGSYGVISVEILCLTALYLQWCDRKHDAYLYIGSAVRLAIALGCTLPDNEQPGLRSEVSHRVRVWWTAYMLDRRLSAGLGLPLAADDRQLRAEFPKPSGGFPSPLPLIINIRIARATSEIMTCFYGNATMTQTDLVQQIRKTLQTLHEIGNSIPATFSIEFKESQVTAPRTSASLYMMLFQAIILCIRPILLQCVKEKVEANQQGLQQASLSPTISRLCQSCLEAANKNIQILSALRRDKTIALFGYFDLDATFSAAFILLMMGFVESTDLRKSPEGLLEAVETLQYLSNAGNKAAQQRLDDLRQLCLQAWSPDVRSDEWRWLQGDAMDANPNINYSMEELEGMITSNNLTDDTFQNPSVMPPATLDYSNMSWDFEFSNMFEADLTDEAEEIYTCFHDPSLPLTGVDELDWAEISKVFQTREEL